MALIKLNDIRYYYNIDTKKCQEEKFRGHSCGLRGAFSALRAAEPPVLATVLWLLGNSRAGTASIELKRDAQELARPFRFGSIAVVADLLNYRPAPFNESQFLVVA